MKFLKIAGRDISNIFRNRFIRVSIIAIIIVPLLYSLLYLSAFWDPYSKLDEMPVAVVNLDKGSIIDNKEVTYGKDILQGLKDNKKVGWDFVSNAKEAKEGLEGEKYYAVFIIPEDFSQKIANAKEGKLEKPSIHYIANEKKNFLASQINHRVALELKKDITKNITSNFTEITFDNLYDIKDGMVSAADGGSKIYEGIGTMRNSIPKMQDGTLKLYDGSNRLIEGLSQLQGKLPKMSTGIGQLKTTVDSASLEFLKHPELKGVLQKENIDGVKTIMEDAEALSRADTSVLEIIPSLITKENMLIIDKTIKDFGTIDIEKANLLLNMSELKDITETKNVENIGKLINDTEALSKVDADKIKPLIGLLSNADKLTKILNEAEALTTVDLNSMSKFLKDQQIASQKFISTAEELNKHKEKVQKAISTSSSLSDAEKLELTSIVEGYNRLTSDTSHNMKDLVSTMDEVSKNISSLEIVQKDIKDNSQLIGGIKTALSVENVEYLNKLLPQLLEMKEDLHSNAQNLASVKMILQLLNTSDVKKSIVKIEALQMDLEMAKPIITDIESKLTEEQLMSIKNSPQLLQQLLKMKQDLKNNEKILEVAQNALNDNNIAMAQQLIGAMPELNGGVNKLYEASNALEIGVGQLQDGSVQLTAGLNELNAKMPELAVGVDKLYDGSKELSNKLKEGSIKISNNLKVSSKEMGEFVSGPMEIIEEPTNYVPNYGTGFAPYFIAISLWVGTLLMFFVITDKVDEDIDASPASVVLGKLLSYGFIGILQAVFVSMVVLILGLEPANVPLYFLFNILLSLVFISIMQSLIYLLGQVGRLLAMVLFILQLTSSEGTFPLELVPRFFKVLNPIMPFTYAIGGLREIISGVNYSNLSQNTIVLIGIMIGFIVISVIMKGHADKVQERIKDKIELTI